MLASSSGCSEFFKRTDVNVGKYGGHCGRLGDALRNTCFYKVVSAIDSDATFEKH